MWPNSTREASKMALVNPAVALMVGFFGLVVLAAARAMFRR
jgi:hypothetical protein